MQIIKGVEETLSFFGSNGPRWHCGNVPFSLHPKAAGEERCNLVLPVVRRSATLNRSRLSLLFGFAVRFAGAASLNLKQK